jgi:AcrR family transcriptional regulator
MNERSLPITNYQLPVSIYQLDAMKRATRATRAKRPPTSRRPQARGEVTRERLLQVAFDLFVRNGFHGTSMRQIADAAGLAVGGIYNHFGSKEAIFAAVLQANHPYRIVEAALQDVNVSTFEAFVREASARVWQAVQSRKNQLMPLMFIEVVEFQGKHLRALAESLFPRVVNYVQRFDQSAERRRPLPNPIVLRTFISFMAGHLMIETALGRSAVFQQMDYDWLDSAVDIFLHGVLEGQG